MCDRIFSFRQIVSPKDQCFSFRQNLSFSIKKKGFRPLRVILSYWIKPKSLAIIIFLCDRNHFVEAMMIDYNHFCEMIWPTDATM